MGPYVVAARIGSGGMGEVFRARDTRLDRDVAIKVLPRAFASDAGRLRRFEQEAKTLAALNHPNVLTVFDAGVHEAAPYLVSELLEGQTLRDEMAGGALPFRRAAELALELAQGLAAAHRAGVIHRDLKPENIFVAKDGRVKILDFGLAKLKCDLENGGKRPASAEAETIVHSTEPGILLGTPAYMSPEQARGEPADRRADIFAFGCVAHEMLGGASPFRRETHVESMNAVLKADPPDLGAARGSIPPALIRIVERCLAKSPDRRFQSADDLAFALESLSSVREAPVFGQLPPLPANRQWPRVLAAGSALLALAAALVFGRWLWRMPEARTPNWHGQRLGGPSVSVRPIVSPDGKELAFTAIVQGLSQLGVMIVESGHWQLLTTNRSRGNIGYPAWSRDQTELLYDRLIAEPLGIYRIPKNGGEERLILESACAPQELPDGSLLVARRGSDGSYRLHRYQLGGQHLEPLNAVLGELNFQMPYRLLPGAREVLFAGWPAGSTNRVKSLWALDLQSGRCELLEASPPQPLLGFDWGAPHVPDPRDSSIVSAEPAGDLYRLMRRSRRSYASPQTLLSLTLAPVDLDIGADGSLYMDQVEWTVEILRIRASNQVETMALSASYDNTQVLPLPGDRLLLPTRAGGRHRLMAMNWGQEGLKPFLISKDECRGPLALLGRERVLCRVGGGSSWAVAIVSLEGRVLGSVPGIPANESLLSLAAAPDARTIYYVANGAVWSVPIEGGSPKRIREGEGVAPYPEGDALLVQVKQIDGQSLVRVPLGGGAEQILSMPPKYRLARWTLAPNAIDRNGRIVIQVAPEDSWHWPAVILDPRTGEAERVGSANADMNIPGWDDQGRVVAAAQFTRSSLWRFRLEK